MVPETKKSNAKHRFLFNTCLTVVYTSVCALSLLLSSCGVFRADEPAIEARKAEIADPRMGDWQGIWELDDGTQSGPLVAQVIALGNGKYRAVLSDAFDTQTEPLGILDDQVEDATARFTGQAQYEDISLEVRAAIEQGKFSGSFAGQWYAGTFELKKTVRLSPTLGARPPSGAVVLFNGKNFRQWKHTGKKPGVDSVKWSLIKGGAMEIKRGTGSIVTRKKFADFKLHLEFRTPFMPEKRGQARGNSGVYLQGRYEVQVLDSYGLSGQDNECGGIYKVGRPLVNMCAPPLQWQTYDITFYAPRFDSTGTKTEDARVTIVHNDVTIHSDRKIPNPTGGALDGNVAEPGGIYLQDHGNPVQFRNIWLVEL